MNVTSKSVKTFMIELDEHELYLLRVIARYDTTIPKLISENEEGFEAETAKVFLRKLRQEICNVLHV